MKRSQLLLGLVPLLWLACSSSTQSGAIAELVSEDGDVLLTVEVERLQTEAEWMQGLRGRDSLEVSHGILLDFQEPSEICIHNQGVSFSIDALFFDAEELLVAIERSLPAGDSEYRCHDETRRVLELQGGLAREAWLGSRLLLR
jgi:uncharacterized membrane protein (UPF0127 family)